MSTDWTSVRAILGASSDDRQRLARAADEAAAVGPSTPLVALQIGPPVPDPEKIVCVGLNYRAHADEVELAPGPAPELFAKYRNALAGPRDAIGLPAGSDAVDYEGELALVIGRRCRDVAVGDAMSCVAGYMVMNDVSARDRQLQGSQWLAGKTYDGFAPCGPMLVTSDEVPDVEALTVTTRLNGEVVQEASVSQMIHGVPEIVSYVSSLMTLEVGDVIATGTPEGVGMSRVPPRYLRGGDRVAVEITGLGTIDNAVLPVDRAAARPIEKMVR